MDQQIRERLKRLIRERSYREGDFTLASGKRSKYYIDLKATTLHPEGAWLIGRMAVDLIQDRRLAVDGVGGLTLGADPLATAISLAAFERKLHWPAYIVRKEPKDHGTARYIEGCENLHEKARLLVVEDVVTTGGSSLKAVDRLIDAGYTPSAVLTVVDRNEGGAEAMRARGLAFLSLFSISDLKSAE